MMTTSERDQLLLANLQAIAYQSGQLLEDMNGTIQYSDFYDFYQGYLPYLRSLPWKEGPCKKLVAGLPQLTKPLLANKILIILLLVGLFFLSLLSLYALPLYIGLLAGIYYGIQKRNQKTLTQIHEDSTQLMDMVRIRNSWT
jgi:hypothetical protein